MVLGRLAMVWSHQGRYEEAQPAQQQVLDIRSALLEPKHFDMVMALENLAVGQPRMTWRN